jgi:Na+/proline symporter
LADSLQTILAVTVVAYALLMLLIGAWAQGRVNDSEDFLVAGRRLPLLLAFPTLLATWFGAGTLLTATDEVRAGGLRMAALEPVGAGLCLILAGLLLAPKLWRMKLLTLGDFYARRFGPRAERWSAVLMVPSYFGWIAAQYVALAGMLEISFGLPPAAGLCLVAAVGIGYTLLGGMWSVTATDALQIALVVFGLLVLGWRPWPWARGCGCCTSSPAPRTLPTADCVPTCSRSSSLHCDAHFGTEPSASWGCAQSTTRRSVRAPSCSEVTPRCG